MLWTEETPKTATGTIAIQVKDFNDNCPELVRPTETLCWGDTAVYVTAKDGDLFPNGAPFNFQVDHTKTEEKWTAEYLNGTDLVSLVLNCKCFSFKFRFWGLLFWGLLFWGLLFWGLLSHMKCVTMP